MKRFNILLVLFAFLIAGVAKAVPEQAPKERNGRGYTFTMCSAEDATGTAVCEGSTGEIYAIVENYDTLTFTYLDTGSGNSCDIYVADQNSDLPGSGNIDAAAFLFGPVNTVSLSDSQEVITLSNVSFYYVVVLCNGGGTSPGMTVEMNAAVGRQRW